MIILLVQERGAFSQNVADFFFKTDTTTSADTSTTPAADGSVTVHTVAGKAQTVTVGPSAGTAVADTAATNTHSSDSGLSSGAVAGVAVGSVAGVGAILALVLVMICAKRRQNRNSRDSSMNNLMAEDRNSKGSIIKGFFYGTHSPTLSAGSSNTAHHVPAFTDNRMKPGTMIYPNGNRDSSVSLQDNQDYSRPVLRVSPNYPYRVSIQSSLKLIMIRPPTLIEHDHLRDNKCISFLVI